MKSFIPIVTLLSLLAGSTLASLSGSTKISMHEFEDPEVFCEISNDDMDLSRVTAVEDLERSECGACIKITSESGRVAYVMAVDKGGHGLDVNVKSFEKLFDDVTGLYAASWEQADAGNCSGIIKGDYNLPGLRGSGTGGKSKGKGKGKGKSREVEEEEEESSEKKESKKDRSKKKKEKKESKNKKDKEHEDKDKDKKEKKEKKDEEEDEDDGVDLRSLKRMHELKESAKFRKLGGTTICNEGEKSCGGPSSKTICSNNMIFEVDCKKGRVCSYVNGSPKCIEPSILTN